MELLFAQVPRGSVVPGIFRKYLSVFMCVLWRRAWALPSTVISKNVGTFYRLRITVWDPVKVMCNRKHPVKL